MIGFTFNYFFILEFVSILVHDGKRLVMLIFVLGTILALAKEFGLWIDLS